MSICGLPNYRTSCKEPLQCLGYWEGMEMQVLEGSYGQLALGAVALGRPKE